MTRQHLVELLRRQVYGTFPSDDAAISDNLVNGWLSIGIALAAKQNYKDNLQIEGIGFASNSFYTIFKGLTITKDENFLWKTTLPEIPIGLGRNEGVATFQLKDSNGQISLTGIPLSENQVTFIDGMREIPNHFLYYTQGGYLYAKSTLLLDQYTGMVRMISGGATTLSSELNVPPDYIDVIVQYVQKQVAIQKAQPQDQYSDGIDNR